MSMMGPVNPRQNIPTTGGYRPGRLLGTVFGGLASIKQRRSMAQIQFDLHAANAATDLQNKKELINHQAAVGDFANEQQSKRNLRYVRRYNKESIKHAINSTEALKNYAEENGLARPTSIQPIVNIAGFNKFGPQFQNVGTVVHERREGPAGEDPKKGKKKPKGDGNPPTPPNDGNPPNPPSGGGGGKGGAGGAKKPRNPKNPPAGGGAAKGTRSKKTILTEAPSSGTGLPQIGLTEPIQATPAKAPRKPRKAGEITNG